jgi:cyclopropane fatty-acyl-phospholipid synthase-like methyltransferase
MELCDLHKSIHELIEKDKSENPVSYNQEKPYQSYERIEFEGLRWSVEKRIREYGLEALYDSSAKVLDIGSNFGFFVAEFAHHFALSHGVEPNQNLNEIGRNTCTYLKVSEKTEFNDVKFQDFHAETEYDRIFSLAAFFTSDKNERTSADQYFSKIERMLSPGGIFFYESTSYPLDESSEDYSHYIASRKAIEIIHQLFDVTKSYETPSGRYHRHFILAHSRK